MIICAIAFFLIIRLQNRRGTEVQAVETTSENEEQTDQPSTDTSNAEEIIDGLPEFDFQLPERIRSIEELEKLHEEMPENSIITLELAAAHVREGDPEAARELVRDIFSRIRKPFPIISLAENLLEQEQFEMSEIILEEGLDTFAEEKIIQQMLMMTYIFNGKSASEIERYIEHLSDKNPSISTIKIGEAYVAVQREEPELAFQTAEDVFDDGEADFAADILFLIGRLLLTYDDATSATEAFQAALEYAPSDWLAVQIEAGIIEAEQ